MAEYKRQHYVPKFYLRGFSSDGGNKISLLVLGQSKFVPAAKLSAQCYEDYFYGDDLKLEKALCEHIEGPSSAIIKGVLASGKLPAEKTEEYATVMAFVLFQHARTAYAASELAEMTEELGAVMIDQVAIRTGMVKAEEVKDAKLGLHKPVLMAVQLAAELLPLIIDLQAKLLVNKTAEDLITCDHPVVMFNPHYKDSYAGSTTGWVVKGLQVFLPLSPRLALCLYDAHTYKFGSRNQEQVEISSPADIQWLNRAQLLNAVNCVYFANPNDGNRVLREFTQIRGIRRSKKVETRTRPDETGAFVHTFKKDIDLRGKLSVSKILTSQRGVSVEEREYGPRQPGLVELHRRFLEEVRVKRYKHQEFPKFLEQFKAKAKGPEGSTAR